MSNRSDTSTPRQRVVCTEAYGALAIRLIAWIAVFYILSIQISASSYGDEKYALRIQSPFAQSIWRMDVDKSETRIVTSSHDKAVTLWRAQDLDDREIFRVPFRSNEWSRRTHGVAISPDGKLIAYAVTPETDVSGEPVFGTGRIFILSSTSNGRVIGTIENVETRAHALRFSPDGAYLAAALSDGCGLRLWAVGKYDKPIYSDDHGYGPAGEDGIQNCTKKDFLRTIKKCRGLCHTPGLAFAPAGAGTPYWLATVGGTGVRLYGDTILADPTIKPARILQQVFSSADYLNDIAFSPDGRMIAIADYIDAPKSDGTTLSTKPPIFVLNLDNPKESARLTLPQDLINWSNAREHAINLSRVEWVKHRKGTNYLYAGGFLPCSLVKRASIIGAAGLVKPKDAANNFPGNCLVRWRADALDGPPEFVPLGASNSDTVMDLRSLVKSKAVLVATLRGLVALQENGDDLALAAGAKFRQTSKGFDFRTDGIPRDLRISADARAVYVAKAQGFSSDESAVQITVGKEKVVVEHGRQTADSLLFPSFKGAEVTCEGAGEKLKNENCWDGVRLNRDHGESLKFFGKKLTNFDLGKFTGSSRAIAVGNRSGAKVALWASSNYLRLVDENANIVAREKIAAEPWRANITPDGQIAVVGHSDGTLRWYRICEEPKDKGRYFFKHLISLYLQRSGRQWKWLAWTSAGYFALESASASLLVGWQKIESSGPVLFRSYAQLGRKYKEPNRIFEALMSSTACSKRPQLEKKLGIEIDGSMAPKADIVVTDATSSDDVQDPLVDVTFQIKARDPNAEMPGLHVELWLDSLVADGERHAGPFEFRKASIVKAREGANIKARVGASVYDLNKPGTYRVSIALPESMRRNTDDEFEVCIKVWVRHGGRPVNVATHCGRASWGGKPPVSTPERGRRLWAVITGFSTYQAEPGANLDFAHVDAIDLARLLLENFRSEAKFGNGTFSGIHLDLFVTMPKKYLDSAAFREDSEFFKPLSSDETINFHHKQPKDGWREALYNALSGINNGKAVKGEKPQKDDVFIYYFSGHGISENESGQSYLVMPEASFSSGSFAISRTKRHHTIQDERILLALKAIGGQRLVIIDACRNLWEPSSSDVDLGFRGDEIGWRAVKNKYLKKDKNIYIFVSASELTRSFEQNVVSFRNIRKKNYNINNNNIYGNGFFTLSILLGLSCDEANINDINRNNEYISIDELESYVVFLTHRDKSKLAKEIVKYRYKIDPDDSKYSKPYIDINDKLDDVFLKRFNPNSELNIANCKRQIDAVADKLNRRFQTR